MYHTTPDLSYEDLPPSAHNTDYIDIAHRSHVRVRTTRATAAETTIAIYDFGINDMRGWRGDYHHLARGVLTVPNSGSITSGGNVRMGEWRSGRTVGEWMGRVGGIWSSGSKATRAFTASDSQTYRWDANVGHLWTCLSPNNYVVAYFDVRFAFLFSYRPPPSAPYTSPSRLSLPLAPSPGLPLIPPSL
ncbi:hypothetical protein M422DRAFT_45772 [Sphaerobolus stellatus SS14]|uniref:Uncharacterized protein n=1 Tax=Sphaerobolus stellatus (strain SS14) TaxID=990650 RepID=A0A0C9U149_SPHS4|nr:hypothetical protein M422DRAFT_51073 [Sphaerobolus stellatus SS14]KIJ47163.1 hypothetical protein M422DRAFT_45772 [Sphaerobolus stellatus SS14]